MLYNIVLVSAIYQHESGTGIPISLPSRWSQSIGFELPVSYNKFSLTFYFTYGNMYVSVL